jgi:outer membrane protein assembly factor BamB
MTDRYPSAARQSRNDDGTVQITCRHRFRANSGPGEFDGVCKIIQGSLTNGVLATAGNVVFAAIRDGHLAALDARTGEHLWHFQTGANMNASPMSYAIDGHQYVAIAARNTLYAFALLQ